MVLCGRRRGKTPPTGNFFDNQQSLAAAGLSFHRQQLSLVIVEEQSLATGLLQQGCDPDVLKLDDLLLIQVGESADGHNQNVSGPEQAGHGYSRKSASFRRRQWKSRGCDGKIRRTLNRVKIGTLSSSEFFDTNGLPH